MIKRITGIVATLCVLAIIAMTVLGAGTYRSMLPEDFFSWGTATVVE